MSGWQERPVSLEFGVGDRVLFSRRLPVLVRPVALGDMEPAPVPLAAPTDTLPATAQGFCLRALPVAGEVPRRQIEHGWLHYRTARYERCFIDLSMGLDAYRAKFSSKTRSTINRKIRKFQDHCGGRLDWVVYRSEDELREFHCLARAVSALTYQEKLLEAGLPEGEDFVRDMLALAGRGHARGYILFHEQRPVAYLYCPIRGNAFVYSYLGYDPEYMKLSVGTVLQWLAFEDIFAAPPVRYFDFDEGQSDHKRLFASHTQTCVNVLFLRPRLGNRLWVRLHAASQDFSTALGRLAERWGLKARLRRLMRFGLGSA